MKSQHVKPFGSTLVDSITLNESRQDLLFVTLILTAIGVFFGGNLLLLNREVMAYSAPIAAVCLAILFTFYALTRILRSPIWSLVITYSLLWVLIYASIPGMHILLYGLGGVTFLYTIIHIRVERKQWVSVILMALIGTAAILGVERSPTSFDILPRLHSGMVHQDTLFNASIAAMLKNYGVLSTGLHGLVDTSYHAFSHMLIAGISVLASAGVLETYGVAPWVLFAPLLIYATTNVSAMLDREESFSLPLIWSMSAFLLVLFPRLLYPWALWDSFFGSESYLVSLGLFLLSYGLLFKFELSLNDLLAIFLSSVLIANTKASVGLIFLGLWMIRLLIMLSNSRRLEFLVLVLSATAVGWSVIGMARDASGEMSIIPLSFVSHSMWGNYLVEAGSALLNSEIPTLTTLVFTIAALIGFMVFHFSVSWLVILNTGCRLGLNNLLRTPVAVYSLAAVAAGLVIVLIFFIPGGSAYYFTNVAFFVSLPAFTSILVVFLEHKIFLDKRILISVGLAIVVMLCWGVYHNPGGYYDYRYQPLVNSPLKNNPLISHLLQLRNSPPNIVLQSSTGLLADNPVKRCTAQPFVFPAVSERPWVDVIQSAADCNYINYGYANYGLNAGDQRVKMLPRLLPGMSIELHSN